MRVLPSAMMKPGRETVLRLLLYGAMAVVSAFWLLQPINDPDFFWHLKTGEWIREHQELPEQDPFNYTSLSVPPEKQRFVLTSYWLSQLVYHAIHSFLGIPGILALKFLIALLFAQALLKLRRGDPVVHAALVLCFLPLFYGLYPLERPQVFSFLGFATLLALLENERTPANTSRGWKSCLPIPALMLLWANLHGGHAIGQIALVLFVVLEAVKFAHPALHPGSRDRYRRLLFVGIAGLVASFINPNTWHALQIARIPATDFLGNPDYFSTVQFFREMRQPLIFIFWVALPLAAASCLSTITKPDITSIALLAGTGYFGFLHVRYLPFFMICAVPVIGTLFSAKRVLKLTRPLLAAGSVVLAAYFSRSELPSRERLDLALRVNGDIFPVRAADFVLANDLKGNLYNSYLWGGYLLWRLGPERKVFVDGRGINMEAVYQTYSINEAFTVAGATLPYWKRLLRQYGVGYVVIPRVPRYKGVVFYAARKLAGALLNDPEWVPVYVDAITIVFVLRMPEHRDVIARHAISKERVLGWVAIERTAVRAFSDR